MRLILVYRDRGLGDAWRSHFHPRPDVELIHGDICQLTCDAVVSPANSFGFMDGGLDWALSERFGRDLQERLQEKIRQRPMGELLVGEAEVVATNDPNVPWLISAPTMRVPMHIKTTINAYLAMKAILVAATAHTLSPPIESVAVPGLGTGVGALAYETAAQQMWEAYRGIILGQRPIFGDFGDAQKHQIELNTLGMIYE